MSYPTLTDLKTAVGETMTRHDTTLSTSLDAAIEAVETHCVRTFSVAASGTLAARVYVPAGAHLCIVGDIGSTTGLVVTTDEDGDGAFETTLDPASYQLEPLNSDSRSPARPWTEVRLVDGTRYPRSTYGRASVQVTARWGWPATPDSVTQAVLLQATRLWKRKDSPEGVVGLTSEGGAFRLAKLDADVAFLLRRFVRGTYR